MSLWLLYVLYISADPGLSYGRGCAWVHHLVWTSSAAKLRAVASHVFLFLAKPKASHASNLSKPAKRALAAAKLKAVASHVVPQTLRNVPHRLLELPN